MMVVKERLDQLLQDRGLCSSCTQARAMIMAGNVLVAERVIDKPGTRVDRCAEIRMRGDVLPYVSRGGLKLAAGLQSFTLSLTDRIAMDVGASTGGFTDCLLQHGVAKVYAVDVGYGQLAWTLREDPRVVNLERTNIRELTRERLPEQPDLAVIDASFISLQKVLPPTLALLREVADIVALIKPQFEVSRGDVGKGGVVRDPDLHAEVIEMIKAQAVQLGCVVQAVVESPLLGPKGNREFLIHLIRSTGGGV